MLSVNIWVLTYYCVKFLFTHQKTETGVSRAQCLNMKYTSVPFTRMIFLFQKTNIE